MKPGIPWSVKGIEPEVREAAKHAARRAGMTLGEWLNGVILDQNEQILGVPQGESLGRPEEPARFAPEVAPPRPEAASRPEQSRPAATTARKDDSALRLHEIAQQLADLAQKERQSAAIRPYEQARREDDQHQAMSRILDRIDDNERQTVDAFSAVNDRLSLLSQQINALNRPPLPERPEDVPGYPALEAAIRNVIAHIEVSERRGREQFAAVQDRLSALADRSAAPAPLSGDDLLRAMPALSGLDARLGEILSRIQHSEASFAERLDSAKAAAQYIASQAQSSAVTAARGEMRDLESRLMHAIGDAASAGLERQQPVMAEIASLRADVANLARRFDDFKMPASVERDIRALQVALEQLSTRVAQGPDMRPLTEMDKRMGEIGRRLDEVALTTRAPPQAGHIEKRLADLDARISEAQRNQADPRALQRLEQNLAAVSARVGKAEAQLENLHAMEKAIRQLHEFAERSSDSASQLAEEAASRAIERMMPQAASSASPELRALEEGLRAVRDSATLSERRNQETLEAVHATLAQIVAKISELEHRPAAGPSVTAPDPAVDADARDAYSDDDDPAYASATSISDIIENAGRIQSPLTAGDDYIAAARRAAQAAARPSALRAECPVQEPDVTEKRGLLGALSRRKAKPAEAGAAPAQQAAERSGRRKRLIYAGLVLLMAASFLAYKNYVKPRLQGTEPAGIEHPATPSAPGKTGFLGDPADNAGLNAGAPPAAVVLASAAEMPPPSLGSQSLREAASAGNANAQFIIAGRYLEGAGVPRDMAKAAYWYGLAAAQGLAPAQYRLATLHELGRGVPKDLKVAASWYERAAMGGNVKAMHNAAVIAAGPQAGPADYARAFRWFKAAAERGFSDSQFNTAILYERGLGTKANAAEAYFWYALAARQGEADARLRMAALGASLSDDQVTALQTLLKAWAPKPVDQTANTVAVTEQDWDVPDTDLTVKQSSLTSAWRAPRV